MAANVQDLINQLGYDPRAGGFPRGGAGVREIYPGLLGVYGPDGQLLEVRNAPDLAGGGFRGGDPFAASREAREQAGFERSIFESDRAFQAQQQQLFDRLNLERDTLTESIRAREQRLAEIRLEQDAATGRLREQLAAERERQERQLQFDREELAENQRQFNANFGEGQRQFGLTFGEGQRQFDVRTGQDYLRSAIDIAGRDPLRSAAFLLGDRGGRTPIEGALQLFKPVGVRPEQAQQPVPLQSGGIVTRPTVALIGEGGPEAVVPLRRQLTGLGRTIGNRPTGPSGVPLGVTVAPRRAGGFGASFIRPPLNIPLDTDLTPYIRNTTGLPEGPGDVPPGATVPSLPLAAPRIPAGPADVPLGATVPPAPPRDTSLNNDPEYWRRELLDAIAAYRANPNDQTAQNRLRLAMSRVRTATRATGIPGTPAGPATPPATGPPPPAFNPLVNDLTFGFWERILDEATRRVASLTGVPGREAELAQARQAQRQAAQRAGEFTTRNLLLRGFYGNIPVGSLNQPPVSLATNAQGEYEAAGQSGIASLYGVPIPAPEAQAARFFQLPPDVQSTLLSAYGLRNVGAGEVLRRIRGVTPVGLRAGTQFGYG